MLEKGDEVYTSDGAECTYICKVAEGHIVRPRYEYPGRDGEFGEPQTEEGDPILVHKVYTEPRRVWIDKQVAEAEKKLAGLLKEFRETSINHRKTLLSRKLDSRDRWSVLFLIKKVSCAIT